MGLDPRGLSVAEFQFTHPGRGATPIGRVVRFITAFQFTHPGRGATLYP